MKILFYCNACGTKFKPKNLGQRYHSVACQQKLYARLHDRRSYWSKYYYNVIKKDPKRMERARARSRVWIAKHRRPHK